MTWKSALRSAEAVIRRAERESLKRQRELERKRKHLEKMQELERAEYEVQVYENSIDVICSYHKECSDDWDWETIKNSAPPLKPNKSNKNEYRAQSAFESFKPNIMHKLLKNVEIKRHNLEKRVEEGRQSDEDRYQKETEEFAQNYSEWELSHSLSTKILAGDIQACADAIDQVDIFNEFCKNGSKVVSTINEENLLEVTFLVNGEDVIPSEKKTLLASGKLSVKKMTKSAFYELYQDYVCSITLRIAREIFALLPAHMIILTAEGEQLNTKTGYIETQPIVSVAIPRETLNSLNLSMLDPSDSMDNFIHRMKLLKTKGFQPIERLSSTEIFSS